MADDSRDRALYIISVAAELAGVHPQTLRIYERKGLIEPSRTEGRSRRYSDRDIALLQRIQELTNEGVGLAGVRKILVRFLAPPRSSTAPSRRCTVATAATSCPWAEPWLACRVGADQRSGIPPSRGRDGNTGIDAGGALASGRSAVGSMEGL
jgi:hypothetical protein